MSLSILNLILLIAATQGFFLALLILHKYRDLLANRILSALIFIYSLVLLNLFFSDIGYYLNNPSLMIIPMGFPFLIGPMNYLYAKYLMKAIQRFQMKDLLHFFPFIICILYFSSDFFRTEEELRNMIFTADDKGYKDGLYVFNALLILHGSIYVFFTLNRLNRYVRYMKDTFSSLERIRLDWLKYITILLGFGLFIFLIENILLLQGINLSNYFNLSSTLIAIYVYTLGYTGFLKSEVFRHPEISKTIRGIPKDSFRYRLEDKQKPKGITEKYEKSGLSEEKAEQYVKKLLKIMAAEKPYKNSNLSLQQLAEMVEVSPHNLSEIINLKLRESFFDFVNKYRIEMLKNDLLDPKKSHFTLLSLANDAGFNSKSSFNAIFKKHTGKTPSQYRSQHGVSSDFL